MFPICLRYFAARFSFHVVLAYCMVIQCSLWLLVALCIFDCASLPFAFLFSLCMPPSCVCVLFVLSASQCLPLFCLRYLFPHIQWAMKRLSHYGRAWSEQCERCQLWENILEAKHQESRLCTIWAPIFESKERRGKPLEGDQQELQGLSCMIIIQSWIQGREAYIFGALAGNIQIYTCSVYLFVCFMPILRNSCGTALSTENGWATLKIVCVLSWAAALSVRNSCWPNFFWPVAIDGGWILLFLW